MTSNYDGGKCLVFELRFCRYTELQLLRAFFLFLYFINFQFIMNFGQILEALKEGKKVVRAGWNGQGMYAYLVAAASYPAQTEHARRQFGALVPYRAYFALKTAQNDVACWQPNTSDMLAEDWQVLED